MVTDEAVLACHQAHLTYLGPLPPGEARTAALLDSVRERELRAHALPYRPQRRFPATQPWVPYRGVWRTVTFGHEGHTVTDRALVIWSAAKARLDSQKRKTLLKRRLNALAHIQAHLNRRRYRDRTYVLQRWAQLGTGTTADRVDVTLEGEDGALVLRFAVHRAQVQAAQARDGKYVLATNATDLTAATALATFKGQDRVEQAFSVVQGPLRVRPFFVQTDVRLQGLLFFTLVALLVRAILGLRLQRAGLALSVERALATCDALSLIEVGFHDGSILREVRTPTIEPQQLLQRLGLPALDRYATGTPLPLR